MGFVLDETTKAATELVARHGLLAARGIISERIAAFERQGSWPDHDLAQLVLNAIEKMPQNSLREW